jgi:CheY-like chemotaxis protein
MMGAAVGFRSEASRGSEFWIDVPVAGADTVRRESRAREVSPVGPLPGGAAATVLYVEDNPSNVEFMQALLDTLPGVRLLSAPTAEIGVELARAHRPAVVIMDINLPGMSGIEALAALRAIPETAAIPVIALSASAMDRDIRRAEEAGFARYLTKPVKVDALTEALAHLLASRPA